MSAEFTHCSIAAVLAPRASLWQASSARLGFDFAALRCRSSVVEHPLGKGEVVSSILTGSTRKAAGNRQFLTRPSPSPPRLAGEQIMFPPAKLGEIWGSLFGTCSQKCTQLTENRIPATAPTIAGNEQASNQSARLETALTSRVQEKPG